jgi:hypothetical protein
MKRPLEENELAVAKRSRRTEPVGLADIPPEILDEILQWIRDTDWLFLQGRLVNRAFHDAALRSIRRSDKRVRMWRPSSRIARGLARLNAIAGGPIFYANNNEALSKPVLEQLSAVSVSGGPREALALQHALHLEGLSMFMRQEDYPKLGHFANLKTLKMHGISELPRDIPSGLRELSLLHYKGNTIAGIQELRCLTTLYLDLQFVPLDNFSFPPSLRHLEIKGDRTDYTVRLARLPPMLTSLCLVNMQLKSSFFVHTLPSLQQLRHLLLSITSDTAYIPFPELPLLERLRLSALYGQWKITPTPRLKCITFG